NIWERINRFFEISHPPGAYPRSLPIPANELGNWVYGRALDLKIWQEYFRMSNANTNGRPIWVQDKKVTVAGPVSKHTFPLPSQPQPPANDVLSALSMLNPELEALRKASVRTQSRFPIHYEEIEQAIIVHVGFLGSVSRVLQLRSVAELALGDSQQA